MNEYIAFMESYCDHYDQLVVLWQEKQRIIADNDLHLLEEQVKKEEVAVLKARGLEEKRLNLQKALGKDEQTLQQLIEAAEGDEQTRLRQVRRRLNHAVKLLQDINESCQMLSESRFAMLEREIERVNQKHGDNKEPKRIMNRSV